MKQVFAIGFGAAALLAAVLATAQDRIPVSLGTATPGGGFVVYGDAVAKTIAATDPGLAIEPRNTAGSVENIPLLESGRLDIGLVQGEAAHEALAGIGRPRADLRILYAMYPTPGLFIVRADTPYRSIADLRGQPVAFGARGSGLVILARYVLDGVGLDMDRDFQAVYLDRAGDGPKLLRDGKVAALWGGGGGWPGFLAVLRAPGGGRFIAPSSGEIERIRVKHPFLKPLTVAPGSYPGQDAALQSVGSWSLILTRRDLPEDTAYRLARALHRGETDLASRLPQARDSTAANTAAAADPALLHPGALRYFREIGAIR